jgi:hypothetical protein
MCPVHDKARFELCYSVSMNFSLFALLLAPHGRDV